jgi:hypothetical protein
MDNNTKARIYGELLNEHTRVGNMISEIKAGNYELTQEQKQQVRILQNRQVEIMKSINKLFSR